ncbi:MAG: N4-gp56 family major capsid protein, partial [Oscillospiraceae bacterium]|nr:N4-gp56 family major capsid protein [Oscillospiraceae bacterium]
LTVDLVEQAATELRAQNAPTINGDYVCILHPYAAYDLMRDPDWRKPHEYVDTDNIYQGELGKIGGVRFVSSTEAKIWRGTGCPANLSVFACLFFGEGAYGVTEVEGGGLQTIVKQKGSAGTADPLDQRSSVGWKAIKTAEILIQSYLIRLECCSSRYSANAAAN